MRRYEKRNILTTKPLPSRDVLKNKVRNINDLLLQGNYIKQPQPAITCSKLTIETLEQGVKYVQS